MTPSKYKELRWQEVLDGEKVWGKSKLCPNDDDKFRTEYVDPLKALAAEGRFEINVRTYNQRGRFNVPFAVMIAGAINYADR
jgi:hypothetical protein